jgi:hypothetical protein
MSDDKFIVDIMSIDMYNVLKLVRTFIHSLSQFDT